MLLAQTDSCGSNNNIQKSGLSNLSFKCLKVSPKDAQVKSAEEGCVPLKVSGVWLVIVNGRLQVGWRERSF